MRQEDRLVKWTLVYTGQALKGAKKLTAAGLQDKAVELIEIFEGKPYQTLPPLEKLMGDLTGAFSRRINVQHRLAYQVLKKEKIVKIIRLWTHYK